jgi:glutamate dehydrogenase/leucine dehydrogenase
VRAARERHPSERLQLRVVTPGDQEILAEPCDILAPNALGGSINSQTIPRLQAKIVCGAANNQLLDPHQDAAALRARSIVYVPDFVANRMGIVNCANEQYGSIPDDPAILRHYDPAWENSVYRITRSVLERAERAGVTSTEAANALADELAEQPHPIFPDRTAQIITGLLASGWASAPAPAAVRVASGSRR